MKRPFRIFCLALTLPALAALGVPARAQQTDGLVTVDSGKVVSILRADMVMLDDDKRYRLDNILVPPYEKPAALADLQKTFLGKRVTVYAYRRPQADGTGRPASDSQGVPLTQIIRRQGSLWAQQELVSQGMAWAYDSPAGNGMLGALKIIEARAREKKLGLWAGSAHAIKTPDNIVNNVGTYQIVEGRILSVAGSMNRIYFNFSKDWRDGFSVLLPPDFQFRWYQDKKDPGYIWRNDVTKWAGRTVRVRGWVTDVDDKPVIEVTDKGQIDVLAQSPPSAPAGAKSVKSAK